MNSHEIYLVYAEVKRNLDTLIRSCETDCHPDNRFKDEFLCLVQDNLIFAREFLAVAFENVPQIFKTPSNSYLERHAFDYYMGLTQHAMQTAFTILDTQLIGVHPHSDRFVDLLQSIATTQHAISALHQNLVSYRA